MLRSNQCLTAIKLVGLTAIKLVSLIAINLVSKASSIFRWPKSIIFSIYKLNIALTTLVLTSVPQSSRPNYSYSIKMQLKSILLFVFSVLTTAICLAISPEPAKIKLHLPVNSSHYPDQVSQMRADFRRMGLNNISIETVDYDHNYQQGLRAGRLGIYFAPPHFAAWAIEHYNFQPLVHLLEPLAYVIAVQRNKPNLFEVNDLAGKRVCARKPLNLDYLLVNKILKNSVVPAEIIIVDQVLEQMKSNSTLCEAYSISRHVFDRLEKQTPERFIKLYQTDTYANYGLISHPGVDQSDLKKIRSYFLLDRTQLMLAPLLNEFAGSHRMVRSSIQHYPRRYWQDLAPYWQAFR